MSRARRAWAPPRICQLRATAEPAAHEQSALGSYAERSLLNSIVSTLARSEAASGITVYFALKLDLEPRSMFAN